MATRLTIVTRALVARELYDVAARSALIALTPPATGSFTDDMLDAWFARTQTAIALADGNLAGAPLAAALASDYLALDEAATIVLRSPESIGSVVAALYRRAGSDMIRHLVAGGSITATEAVATGIADALVPTGSDWVKWLVSWLGDRSLAAMHSAATLMRRNRHSYAEERIEFARLFSTGEPQRGLAAFLRKEPLDFSSGNIVEIV